MSSIYNANRIGERTEPCLTPNMILKKFENALSHLTHEKQSENKFIIKSSRGTGMLYYNALLVKEPFNEHKRTLPTSLIATVCLSVCLSDGYATSVRLD